MNMTSNDNLVPNRQVVALHVLNDGIDTGIKTEGLLETKLQDIGCCGDVPKVLKPNNKKRDKLLEWLKSSQLKREENNRQVFSRWIDMVDNGAIDLTSLSNYPGKSSKQVNNFSNLNSTVVNSVQLNPETPLSQLDSANMSPQISKPALVANQVKPSVIPATNICPPYFSPINNPNYYGMSQNWFSGNQAPALYSPLQIPQQMPLSIYPGFGSYCASSPMLGNYYQYVPLQQACTLCPPYVVPNLSSGLETSYSITPIQMQSISQSDNSSVNIDVNKWFDVLNEIKINPSPTDTVEDSVFQPDSKEADNNI